MVSSLVVVVDAIELRRDGVGVEPILIVRVKFQVSSYEEGDELEDKVQVKG